MKIRYRHFTLAWQGPFALTDFFNGKRMDDLRCPGAYLWIEEGKISRAGTAGSLPNLVYTMQLLYQSIISGAERIPATFRSDRKNWEPLKHPDRHAILAKLEKLIDLVKDAHRYQASIKVFIAPCPEYIEHLNAIHSALMHLRHNAPKVRHSDNNPFGADIHIEHLCPNWIDELSGRSLQRSANRRMNSRNVPT